MKKYLLMGLAFLVPIIMTVLIFVFCIDFLTDPILNFINTLTSEQNIAPTFLSSTGRFYHLLAQFLILFLLIVAILFIGYLANNFFFRFFFSLGEKILSRIPLLRKIYKTSQDITKTVFQPGSKSFQQVVLVPFPHKPAYSIGFTSNIQNGNEEEEVPVFIPTPPNPTTGILLTYKKKDLVLVEIQAEEAIKHVISLGLVKPEKKKK